MYIKELIIINYKSCKNLKLSFSKDDPNVFIGINDCGKSTILKAAELLLGDKSIFNFTKDSSARSDLSNTVLAKDDFNQFLINLDLPKIEYNGNQCIILAKLVIEGDDIVNDEISYTNHLKWSIDQTDGNDFWYGKVFDCSNNSINELLLCTDSKNPDKSKLWNSAAPILNKIIKELEITAEEIENENKKGRFSNMEKFRAIYNKLDTERFWTEYKTGKSDKSFFPIFRYLNWECSLEDINKIASDIMMSKMDTYMKPLKVQAYEAQQKAEEDINAELKELKNSIKDELPNIVGLKTKVYFNIKESITDIFVNKKNSDGDIHLESQGDGLKRQIWFALIKSSAFKKIEEAETNKKFIWAFDEPETHLYPSAQRQFFDTIKKISKSNIQTLICTHSTVFIDKTKLVNIRNVFLDEIGYTEYSICKSIDEVFESLKLRNSDFLFYNKFLVIEGDTELTLIPELYKIINKRSLEDDNIQLVNLKGKSKWLEGKKALENVFEDFRKTAEQVVYIFDGDAKYDLGAKAITDNMFFIGKQDIEDSISNEVWVHVVNDVTNNKIEITNQDIQNIKDTIPEVAKVEEQNKFYKLLQKEVRNKMQEVKEDDEPIAYDILPSKGSEEAELLLKYINDENQLDAD
jgi:predicted ATP-dependent endonuclease of OLD family